MMAKKKPLQVVSKHEAVALIKDSLSVNDPYMKGVATGLCGAFHMSGLLTEEEMNELLGFKLESDEDFAANVLH